MKLLEVLNKPATFNWTETGFDSHGYAHANFTIDGKLYSVSFDEVSHPIDNSLPDIAEVSFTIDNNNVPHRNRHKQSNTGSAFVVFATVMAIVQDFIRKNSPTVIAISSEGETRSRVYERLVKSFAQNNWTIERTHVDGTSIWVATK